MNNLSMSKARKALLDKKFSSEELTKFYLNRIEKFSKLNAFITVCGEKAIEQANVADKNIACGNARYLEGIPLGIKDLFLTKGIRTTAGSRMLHNFIPPYESTVTQKLLDSGCVFLGKTNMDEFAMGSANITSYFGNVINPWSKGDDLVPGGSSGGSAAAVAGDLCVAATGSDTGGSVRQPAAFCGIVGLKPTYGRCSRYGMVAFSSSLDQAGPMTKTVEDAAMMLNSIAGYDANDATSKNVDKEDFEKYLGTSLKGMKVGVLDNKMFEGASDCMLKYVEDAKKWLQDAGAELVSISLPPCDISLAAYYIIAPAEASSNLARYDGVRYGYRSPNANSLAEMYENTRYEGFGEEVRRRIMIGTYVLSSGYFDAYYSKAKAVQKVITQQYVDIFKDVDVILTPTTADSAFPINKQPDDPLQMYLNDIFTVTVNIAGLPAISVPAGLDQKGLPLGVQLIASHFKEGNLIAAGQVIEKNSGFKLLSI